MAKETSEHARPTLTDPSAQVPEPSHAEGARTLIHLGRVGTLTTQSRKHEGWPFGSVAPYGLDDSGAPTFLISTMAMHTQHILADGRASLLVTEPEAAEDPLGAGRVTLMGRVARTPDDALASVRERYLERYDNASYWVDFKDFAFFQMELIDLYFVGGFGVMGWVTAEDYLAAPPDPLADKKAGILAHMNADHEEALMLLACAVSGLDGNAAKMTAVDRLGFHVRLTTSEGFRGVRVPFLREVHSSEETRAVLVEMVKAERQKTKS